MGVMLAEKPAKAIPASCYGKNRRQFRTVADDMSMIYIKDLSRPPVLFTRDQFPTWFASIAPLAATVDFDDSVVRPVVRPPMLDYDTLEPYTPETPQALSTLIPTGGASVSAQSGNNIQVPTGYNALAVYVGSMSINRETLRLYVFDGTTTTPVELYLYGHTIIYAAAGTTISLGATGIDRDGASYANVSDQEISVIPCRASGSLAMPATVQKTITPDRCAPHLFGPTHFHLALPGEFGRISVEPAPRARNLFIQEAGSSSLTPLRHIYIAANESVAIQCRLQLIIVVSMDADPVTFNVPVDTLIDPTSVVWEPDFTATGTATIASGDVADFKAKCNTAGINDIYLTPGIYDLTSVANCQMNITNYGSGQGGGYAWGKNLRIQSTTGNPNDVIFRVATPASSGAAWRVDPVQGVAWVLKNITFDFAGSTTTSPYTAMMNFNGTVHMVGCRANFAAIAGDTGIRWLSSGSTGAIQAYVAWCDFRGAYDDMIASNKATSACQVDFIGCYMDGNGPNPASQIITNHTGGTVACWGVSFGNLTKPSYTPRVSSDNSTGSNVWLMYCKAYPENFPTSTAGFGGITVTGSNGVNLSFLHFCDFQAGGAFDGIKSAIRTTIRGTITNRPLCFTSQLFTGRFVGCDLYALRSGGTGSERIFDCLGNGSGGANLTVFGSRLTVYSETSNQGVIRLLGVGGSTTTTVSFTNVLVRAVLGAVQPKMFELNTGASQPQILQLKNVIFTSGFTDCDETIDSAASTSNTASRCYFQQNAAPTNWSSKFPGASNVTFSRTAPALAAKDIPTLGGNVDTGASSIVGSCDVHGMPYLGGTWSQGCRERQEVRSSFLAPAIWPLN